MIRLTAGSVVLLTPIVVGAAPAVASTTQAKSSSASVGTKCAATAVDVAATTTSPTPSVVKHADGGASYVYKLGAQDLSFPVFPAGFNAQTASPAVRAEYGLPPEPSDPSGQAAWTRLMATLGQQAAPQLKVQNVVRNDLAAVQPAKAAQSAGEAGVNTNTTNIWAGYVSQSSSTNYYGLAQGIWNQPSIGSTSCAGATHLTWVGLGGYGTSQLLQDGTNQSNQAWFEYLGPNGTGVNIQLFPSNITIKSGDSVLADTLYESGTAYWIVEDQTTGKMTEATLSNASSFYNGSSVEFIDERTSFGCPNACTASPLANYGSTDWTTADAATSSAYKNTIPLSSLSNVTNLTMDDPNQSNRTLAIATNEGYNGSAFETDWKNCS